MSAAADKILFEKARKKIAIQTGLDFSGRKFEDLERELNRVAKLLSYKNTEDFIADYLSGGLSPCQIEVLIEAITIGETYFFREDKIFDVLEKTILPYIVGKKQNLDKRIRIWSSGCANGEEPYSIAILIHKMRHLLDGFEVSILATDINVNALQKAMKGVFTEWSFRNTSDWIQKNYFQRTSNNKYRILPEIRQMVHFEYLNLAEDQYPSLFNDTNAIDIIFCRNVLMYLTEESVSSVLKRFSRCLLDEGLLIVSACEVSNSLLPEFIPLYYPECILYQKQNSAFMNKPILLIENERIGKPIPRDQAKTMFRECKLQSRGQVEEKPRDPVAMESLCRITANQGRLAEALALCEELLILDKLNPTAYYLQAMILFELDRFDEAGAALRRTLFLDGNRASAYFMLGCIARQLGLETEAKRHFRNALDVLSRCSPEMIVPDSEGLQVSKLAELIQGAINSL